MRKEITKKKYNKDSILVTGGGGYIGSHTIISLLRNGYNVVAIDNFSNCKKNVITKLKKISKNNFLFYNCDIRNYKKLASIISSNKIKSIIHFAALKFIEDSNRYPKLYFNNNVNGSINLIKLSKKYPKYYWDKNFGYGTKDHLVGLKKYGITRYHRKKFKPIHNILFP